VPAANSDVLHDAQRRYAMQCASTAAADDDNASAAQELDRVFNQADFPRMRIIGQFNLGFIVVRLGQDLFIIDQHASDEKFNFERLASTTVLNKQPLLRPQTLDLSPGEGVTVRENLAVFVKNGFDIQEQANGQLALAAVPFSKNTTFGRDDVLELVGMLSGHGDHQGAMSLSAFPSAATLHRPSRYDSISSILSLSRLLVQLLCWASAQCCPEAVKVSDGASEAALPNFFLNCGIQKFVQKDALICRA